MKGVSTFSRTLKNGKISWGYRFDTAPIGNKRQQVSKSGYKSKKEALRAGMTALQQYETIGQVVSPSDMSFSDYLDLWVNEDCNVDLKPTTILNYQKKINNHIKPNLGAYRLRSIKKEDLQAFIIEKFDDGYSYNTLSSLIGILSKSFNYAVDHNYLLYSPAVRIKIPRNRTPKTPTRTAERNTIPIEAIEQIFKRFPETEPSHIPLRLGFECGLRSGEAFALVWEDIDLDNGTITVNRQIQWQEDNTRTTKEKLMSNGSSDCGNGYWYFTNPKYSSFRTVKISDNLTELLRREKERQEAMKAYYRGYYAQYYSEHPITVGGKANQNTVAINPINAESGNPINFVCVRGNGTYISSRTMQHTSRVIRTGIYDKFTFHALRHTHASILYEQGLNDKYISERLGHKDNSTTREVYIHLTEQSREQGETAVKSIFNALGY